MALSFFGVTFITGGVEQLTAASGGSPPETTLRALPGQTQVIDGATLRLGPTVVRLQNMTVDASPTAIRHLAALVRDQSIECTVLGIDDDGRRLGRCRNEAHDLTAEN